MYASLQKFHNLPQYLIYVSIILYLIKQVIEFNAVITRCLKYLVGITLEKTVTQSFSNTVPALLGFHPRRLTIFFNKFMAEQTK